MKPRILIIDDEPAFVNKLSFGLKDDYQSEGARTAGEAYDSLKRHEFDLILLDLMLNPAKATLDGLEHIEPLKKKYSKIPLVVVTADEKTETVVRAIKLGADDFLRKSNMDLLEWKHKFGLLVENKNLLKENLALKNKEAEKFPFIGRSPKIAEIKRTLCLLAENPDITVLITGETGVGKEVAARYLHQQGKRKNKPFVPLNLSAIQKELLESTLFGHKKGAFTGADYDREGYFRKANGGILFLDEISEVDNNIQVKLLRFLQDKTIEVVGDEKEISIDVQIIAATNQNLKDMLGDGRFREDLYYRLKNLQVELPPLRERGKDVEMILFYYLKLVGYDDPQVILDSSVIDRLLSYDWPGNVRDLKHTVDHMLLQMKVKRKSKIDITCLPKEIIETKKEQEHDPPATDESSTADFDLEKQKAQIELSTIEEALTKTYGQKQAAAQLLGMSADNLRYRVVIKYWGKYPQLFRKYPKTKQSYKLSES